MQDRPEIRQAIAALQRLCELFALRRQQLAAGDARQRRYRLTAEGRRLLERLRRGRERAIAAVWDGFDAAALRGFVAFAGELADHLEAYAKQRKSG